MRTPWKIDPPAGGSFYSILLMSTSSGSAVNRFAATPALGFFLRAVRRRRRLKAATGRTGVTSKRAGASRAVEGNQVVRHSDREPNLQVVPGLDVEVVLCGAEINLLQSNNNAE